MPRISFTEYYNSHNIIDWIHIPIPSYEHATNDLLCSWSDWIVENVKGNWYVSTSVIAFDNETDAVLFKLKWD